MHEDLNDLMRKNPDETVNNGLDDDGNCYIDYVHGRNLWAITKMRD